MPQAPSSRADKSATAAESEEPDVTASVPGEADVQDTTGDQAADGGWEPV